MGEALSQFWAAQSTNIMVSLVVGFVFFVLGPLGLWFSGKKIRRERNNKAHEILIDIIEGMIVNQTLLDEQRLLTLFEAVERDVGADISAEYSYEDLLGDVALRFERSRHLGRDQKQEYYAAIQKTVVALQNDQASEETIQVPRRYAVILSDLRNLIEVSKLDAAKPLITELETRLTGSAFPSDPISLFRFYIRIYRKNPLAFVLATIVVLLVYIFLILNLAQGSGDAIQ